MSRTYYQILGVSKTDDTETIKKAFRKLARENHPDLHPDDSNAKARFQEIGEAWEVLGDVERRKAYDIELSGTKSSAKKKQTAWTAGPAGVKTVSAEDFQNFMSGFDDIFAPINEKSGASKGPFDIDSMFDQIFKPGKK